MMGTVQCCITKSTEALNTLVYTLQCLFKDHLILAAIGILIVISLIPANVIFFVRSLLILFFFFLKPKYQLIFQVVKVLGNETAVSLFHKTVEIQLNGGEMTAEGQRM